MFSFKRAVFIAAAASYAYCTASAQEACLSPYQLCQADASCVIDPSFCGICSEGEYLCPYSAPGQTQTVCVADATAVADCPVSGTHYDATLSPQQRVKYLVSQTTVTEQISQLTNESPALPHVGVPFYNCESHRLLATL